MTENPTPTTPERRTEHRIPAAAPSFTRHGFTITLVESIFDDFSITWAVWIDPPEGRRVVSVARYPKRDDARKLANACYRLARPGLTALELRSEAYEASGVAVWPDTRRR